MNTEPAWPDEAYGSTANYIDYGRHYFELEKQIIHNLGSHFGAPYGPFPEICSTCHGGPCRQIEECSKQILWTEPADYLLELANERLSKSS